MEPQRPGDLSVSGKGELVLCSNVCDQITEPRTSSSRPGEGALMSGMHGLERDNRGRDEIMWCCKSNKEKVVFCDRCKNGYHLTCLRPILAKVPHGSWLCRECAPPTTPVPSFSREDILAFFGIQQFSEELSKWPATPSPKAKKRPRSKTRRWQRYVPSKDQGQRLNQLKSLAEALVASNSRFTDELIFSPEMAIKSANNVDRESSRAQVLHKGDRETLSQCKVMFGRGECPPLLVVSDPVQGYIVQADDTIEDMTFICEYAGEVDYLKNRNCDSSCSLMTLLEATNRDEDLVIYPDNFGNISRFLSGVNNFRRGNWKKLNCKLVRYNVDGEMRVFVVAVRKIEKGITLYCDYNAGGYTYPTDNFV